MWGAESMDPPPISFRSLNPSEAMSRERMIASVTYGKPGTSMMAFNSQLSAEQIEAVVSYVWESFMSDPAFPPRLPDQPESNVGLAVLHGDAAVPRATRSDPDPTTVDPDAPMPLELTGDPVRGGRLFAESCVACHGPKGDGRGPRAYFIYPRPMSFVAGENRQRLNRRDLFNSIKHGVRGREMPAWGKILNDQEIADVAEYVFGAFVEPQTPEWSR
jgi:mono/diheme cytochrome c family protein